MAAHSSKPHLGKNALVAAAQLTKALAGVSPQAGALLADGILPVWLELLPAGAPPFSNEQAQTVSHTCAALNAIASTPEGSARLRLGVVRGLQQRLRAHLRRPAGARLDPLRLELALYVTCRHQMYNVMRRRVL